MAADALGRCFVVMPFGDKPGPGNTTIRFDAVYQRLLKPAIAAAGLRPHRADAERRAGSIHDDMFQDLLLAEFVVADLTVDNPNVWYEIGVRHALRAAGAVLTYSSARERLPFDIAGQRCLRYAMADGAPDGATLERDREALTAMIRATLEAWRERKGSPVYQSLPCLKEPDWKTLRVGDVNAFWQQLDAWRSRVEVARRKGRAGDILTLAEETPNRLLAFEALLDAAEALRALNRPIYGLATARRALALEPRHVRAWQLEAIFLGRTGRHAEAAEALERLAEEQEKAGARSGETLGLLARTRKDDWNRLRRAREEAGAPPAEAAKATAPALHLAVEAYARGYRADPADHFPGINALTLGRLWERVTGRKSKQPLDGIAAGLRWSIACALERERGVWPLASLGELALVQSDHGGAADAYEQAAAVALDRRDAFALDSMAQQLRFLADLGFEAACATECAALLEDARKGLGALHKDPEPNHVVLFSGHMVDKPDRPSPRFPEAKADAAGARIAAELDRIGAGAGDLGISQAACGGDLLFAEACIARGMRLWVMLPQEEPAFRRDSVFGAARWQEAYDRVRASPLAEWRVAPEELGPPPEGVGIYERCNRWMMHTALSQGVRKVDFLALWDGGGGDGPGGTAHVGGLVAEMTGRQPAVVDPKAL
jgi:tetratricopeptide (TPR) repeat protein